MFLTDLARICHEAHRAYCLARGDLSVGVWESLPDWLQEGIVAGVRAAHQDSELTAEGIHGAWVADKVAKGWIYGPVKAPDLKQHPCLLSFDKLSPEDQSKDALFLGIVNALRAVTEPTLAGHIIPQQVANPSLVPPVPKRAEPDVMRFVAEPIDSDPDEP
jgi:hypothetical protein